MPNPAGRPLIGSRKYTTAFALTLQHQRVAELFAKGGNKSAGLRNLLDAVTTLLPNGGAGLDRMDPVQRYALAHKTLDFIKACSDLPDAPHGGSTAVKYRATVEAQNAHQRALDQAVDDALDVDEPPDEADEPDTTTPDPGF